MPPCLLPQNSIHFIKDTSQMALHHFPVLPVPQCPIVASAKGCQVLISGLLIISAPCTPAPTPTPGICSVWLRPELFHIPHLLKHLCSTSTFSRCYEIYGPFRMRTVGGEKHLEAALSLKQGWTVTSSVSPCCSAWEAELATLRSTLPFSWEGWN